MGSALSRPSLPDGKASGSLKLPRALLKYIRKLSPHTLKILMKAVQWGVFYLVLRKARRARLWPPRTEKWRTYLVLLLVSFGVFGKLFLDSSQELEMPETEKKRKLHKLAINLRRAVEEEERRLKALAEDDQKKKDGKEEKKGNIKAGCGEGDDDGDSSCDKGVEDAENKVDAVDDDDDDDDDVEYDTDEEGIDEESDEDNEQEGDDGKDNMITTDSLIECLIDGETGKLIILIGVDPVLSRFDDGIKLLVRTIRNDIEKTLEKTAWAREGKPDRKGNPIPETFKTGSQLDDMIFTCQQVRGHFWRYPEVMEALQGEKKMKAMRLSVSRQQRWKVLKLLPYVYNISNLYLANSIIDIAESFVPVAQVHYTGQIAKHVMNGGPDAWKRIQDSCTAVAALVALRQLFSVASDYVRTCVQCELAASIKKDVYAAILRQDVEYFDSRDIDSIQRLTWKSSNVLNKVMQIPLDLTTTLSSIATHVMVIYGKSGKFASASFAAALVTIPINILMTHISDKRYDSDMRKNYNMWEVLHNIRTVRSFGRENLELKNYVTMQKANIAHRFQEQAFESCMELVNSAMYSGIEISFHFLAAYLVHTQSGKLGVEDIAILSSSAEGLWDQLESLYYKINSNWFDRIGGAEQLVNLLEQKSLIETDNVRLIAPSSDSSSSKNNNCKAKNNAQRNVLIQPETLEGRIEFKDVHFHYPTRTDAKVLKGLSFKVGKSKVVALVGPSGSGKSSVVRILQRFYKVQKGDILLDGEPLEAYEPSKLRQRIGVVSQEPVLFDKTIEENLVYGCIDYVPSHNELLEALKKADAWEFVKKLPEGLRTQVGSGGIKLSGGQKQRIAIARALLTKPSMLLLDEATSALDTHAEARVQKALDEMVKEVGGTTLVIAHRLSTIRKADKIIVLKDGKKYEEGSHNDLMKLGGEYASLVRREGKVELAVDCSANNAKGGKSPSSKAATGSDGTDDSKAAGGGGGGDDDLKDPSKWMSVEEQITFLSNLIAEGKKKNRRSVAMRRLPALVAKLKDVFGIKKTKKPKVRRIASPPRLKLQKSYSEVHKRKAKHRWEEEERVPRMTPKLKWMASCPE